MAGITAFREAFLSSVPAYATMFESVEARRARYEIFWAMYENTAYRNIHKWSTALRHQLALYKYTRNLYCPAYRLGNFYASHLWGGAVDLTAGPTGAIPIKTKNESLRPAIAALWLASNFAARKDVIALRGTIEGDTILRVEDDPNKERVYLSRVDPRTVADLVLDFLGNVKGYTIEEDRVNPENEKEMVTYRLIVTRDGDNVVYETFLNDAPYAWNGQPEAWYEPYTFVPMVLIKHMDVGLSWGWSELHAMRSKVYEVDDLASMISDQIRKSVDPVWLMKGMSKQSLAVTGARPDETGAEGSRPAPGREELKAIWNAPSDASAEPMTAPLNLTAALAHVNKLLSELERDYPELQQDIWSVGTTSGRALRVARQRIEAKVMQRRAGYDAGLVKIHQMAIAIGGMRKYKGYKGFNLKSYEKGKLDHSIDMRPVFAPDPQDKTEISQELWQAAKLAVDAGASLAGFLRQSGWSEEDVKQVVSTKEEEEENGDNRDEQ